MNDLIVRKIKNARLERGVTQKNLADHLGKTAAAISDMERGKVQVSASNLYQIAQFLNKPIEYFYGEEFGYKEVQDLVAVMRKQPSEARKQSVITTSSILNLYELAEKVKTIPEDQPIPTELVKQFFQIFIPFSININQMTVQLNEIRDILLEEMKIQGFEISDLLDRQEK